MSSTTPSATRNSASLARLHRENGSPCSAGLDLAIFLISRRCASVNTGGRPPAYRGYNESNPSALKSCSTSRTRSSLVKASRAICATLMPCAGHSTICARRHVTTDPDPRRTIRFRRLPSSSLISRTRTRPAIPRSVTRSTSAGNPRRPAENRANVDGYGTRLRRMRPTLEDERDLEPRDDDPDGADARYIRESSEPEIDDEGREIWLYVYSPRSY